MRKNKDPQYNSEKNSVFALLHDFFTLGPVEHSEFIYYTLKRICMFTNSEYACLYVHSSLFSEAYCLFWNSAEYGMLAPELVRSFFCKERIQRTENFSRSRGGKSAARIATTGRQAIEKFFSSPDVFSDYSVTPVFESNKLSLQLFLADHHAPHDASLLYNMDIFAKGLWAILCKRKALSVWMQSQKNLELARRTKSDFLANVSHELRTPLNGVFSMLQMLLQSPLTRQQEAWVQTAGQSAKALLRILSDILDISQIEEGKMPIKEQPFDLKAVITSVVDIFRIEAHNKQIFLSFSLASNLPDTVLGDAPRLRQILFNLIGNAIKFTPKGSVHIECCLLAKEKTDEELKYAPKGIAPQGKPRMYFSIVDTGPGIPEDALKYLFKEPFTQVDFSSTKKNSGAGLGLNIVARLVKLMGGTLTADSELGKGTNISFCIPLNLPAEGQAAEQDLNQILAWSLEIAGNSNKSRPLHTKFSSDDYEFAHYTEDYIGSYPSESIIQLTQKNHINSAANRNTGSPVNEQEMPWYGDILPPHPRPSAELVAALNILVAEDDKVSQFAIASMLRKEGHHVTIVDNGEEALTTLLLAEEKALLQNSTSYDCLITDIQMPVMDGVELVRRIRNPSLQAIKHWDILKEKNGASNYLATLEHSPTAKSLLKNLLIVTLTAHALEGDAKRFIEAGMDYYLSKPINLQDLRTVLKDISRRIAEQ